MITLIRTITTTTESSNRGRKQNICIYKNIYPPKRLTTVDDDDNDDDVYDKIK
jgi:hypothetical protein